jgi:hypothetical protein
LKIQTVKTCTSASSTRRNFYFWKTLKSRFLAEFQSFIFRADFAALTVADSMPKVWLKSLKPHNFWIMSPNVTCSISLESYHPYLPQQKNSKILKIECIHSSLPKNEKSRFGSHCPFAVNERRSMFKTSTLWNLQIFLRRIKGFNFKSKWSH